MLKPPAAAEDLVAKLSPAFTSPRSAAAGSPRLLGCRPWRDKTDPIFSNAVSEVRRLIWEEWVFTQPQFTGAIEKLLDKLKEYLLDRLTMAA